MKVVELLKISMNMLKVMSENDVLRDDWQYVDVYEQYQHLRAMGMKYDEVMRIIAKEKNKGVRTIERAFKRLSSDCM